MAKKIIKWYVYMLKCKNNTLYTGATDNIQRRCKQHKNGCGAKYTRAFGVKSIVLVENHPSSSKALKREYQIKKMTRLEKLNLIKGYKIAKR